MESALTWEQLLESPEDELYGSEGRRVRAKPLLARLTPMPDHIVTMTTARQIDVTWVRR